MYYTRSLSWGSAVTNRELLESIYFHVGSPNEI